MNSSKLKIVLFAFCLGLSALIIGCTEKTAQDKVKTPEGGATPVDSLVIELAGADSVSVFDLLKQQHEIEFKSSLMGNLVTMIDSVVVGSGYYWFYSVNDSMGNMACEQYITSDGDIVHWYFRKVGQ